MLLRVKQNASNYSQYTYNADGLRIKKDVMKDGQLTTSKYVWGNNGLAGIITNNMSGTTTVVPLYDSSGEAIGFSVKKVGGRPASVSTEPAVYTYVKNLQGDVIRILDKTGKTVVSYTYDPWGVPTVTGDTELAALNPCSYRGYDYDEDTSLYYVSSRYYNPTVGRWLNCDDVQTLLYPQDELLCNNLYAYCNNSPIANVDIGGYVKINIKWLGTAVDLIIWVIPALFAIAKIWKTASRSASKLVSFGNKLIATGKQLLRRFDNRLYCAFARDSTYRVVRTIGVLAGIMSIVASPGSVVQYIIDILDGKWDGYFDTNRFRPRLDLTKDY